MQNQGWRSLLSPGNEVGRGIAEELVRLPGKVPGQDVEIIYTGLRAGEKLYEELITEGEGIVATKYDGILVLRPDGWNGKGNQEEFQVWLDQALQELYRIAACHDARAIRQKLAEIIKEYAPQQQVDCVLRPGCGSEV